jgi:hypothetical protein
MASIEGGALGMASGEHFTPKNVGLKYYVVGRGRYAKFYIDPSTDVDMRNVLPLSAHTAFYAMRDAIADETWNAFTKDLTKDADASDDDAFQAFIEVVWKPTVDAYLEAHSGLIGDEHNPQLTSGGVMCFDVRLMKLMARKTKDDGDINGDIGRTRAVELLRMIHTRLNELPREFTQALFRGPKHHGAYEGLMQGSWPDNGADEPFSAAADNDLRYAPAYEGRGPVNGPSYKVFERPWGLVLAVVKPGKREAFDGDADIQALEDGVAGGGVADGGLAGGLAGGTEGPDHDLVGGADFYARTKGSDKHNRFGRPKDIDALQWTTHGKSCVGTRDGLACAWVLSAGEDVAAFSDKLVWVPPLHAGKADGYYADDMADQGSIDKWMSGGFTKTTINPENWGLRSGMILEKI